jgi:hypothetical protein
MFHHSHTLVPQNKLDNHRSHLYQHRSQQDLFSPLITTAPIFPHLCTTSPFATVTIILWEKTNKDNFDHVFCVLCVVYDDDVS